MVQRNCTLPSSTLRKIKIFCTAVKDVFADLYLQLAGRQVVKNVCLCLLELTQWHMVPLKSTNTKNPSVQMYCCTHVQSKWALVNREHHSSTAQHGLWRWGWREVELNSSDTHTSQLGAGFWTGNTRWRILSLTYCSKVSDVVLYCKTCSNFHNFYLLFSLI